jgi:hypothetical protein
VGGSGPNGLNPQAGGNGSAVAQYNTASAVTGITASTPLGGSGIPLTTVQPTVTAECVVVVLP